MSRQIVVHNGKNTHVCTHSADSNNTILNCADSLTNGFFVIGHYSTVNVLFLPLWF